MLAHQNQVRVSRLNLKHIIVNKVGVLVHSKQIQFLLSLNSECLDVVKKTLRYFSQSLNTAFYVVDVLFQNKLACLLLDF